MGCGKSSEVKAVTPAGKNGKPQGTTDSDDVIRKSSSKFSNASNASEMSASEHKEAHVRLRKLRELDETTKIPFIMVELRGDGHRNGFIEVCGKDEYDVYHQLEDFLVTNWQCKKLDCGDLNDDTPVPFCDTLYKWESYLAEGEDGKNNMGLSTMRLVDFMCNHLSWTLGVVNGGNVGEKGEIREQQIIFKAPHPMNMVAPHVMIELRSAGFIEVCGHQCGILDQLEAIFIASFGATRLTGHQEYCDRFYQTRQGIFKERGCQGENNLGLLTVQVCDAVVGIPGWSLVTLNGGNYGESGRHREQQLVFRWDNHPLQNASHLMVELRAAGYVEVNGIDVKNIHETVAKWLKASWGCSEQKGLPGQEVFYDKKYSWNPKDIMVGSAEVVAFMHHLGWQMQVCSQGTVQITGVEESREQQILFRPGASGIDFVEPHLFMELYMGEGRDDLYNKPDVTQVLANQHIRMCPVGDCGAATDHFHSFITEYLGAEPHLGAYNVDCFLARGPTDNNLGLWTMRVCDFMVDRLGWSFVVCNVCNTGKFGRHREQQLVFRYDGERREIPVTLSNVMTSQELQKAYSNVQTPSYWCIPRVLTLEKVQATIACVPEELKALQEIVDKTFKRILTRDRVYEYQITTTEEMPYRLEVVHAFRSENMQLYSRFMDRRKRYPGGTPMRAKTLDAGAFINRRLEDGEAYLFHGTNPSSAMSILKSGFSLSNAGKSTGTMFGYGVYLAECCSKSDEYARDDGGGTFPGLMAALVCRCLIGKPHVVQVAGDYIAHAKDEGLDCVCGDRETKVGTYREFVFFDESQILPEYTVIYRRQYSQTMVPEVMKCTTRGTTGKAWQVKLDKQWANIPSDANRWLLEAELKGESKVEVEIGPQKYAFDLEARTQTNMETHNVRVIRPPMVKPTADLQMQRSPSMFDAATSPDDVRLTVMATTSMKRSHTVG